ncbi:hypothetical protein BDV23DRAFT_145610 [Aspergillus alliaceus]|uniref:Uncharacterized protein n=1 Tax=Petromyces alliaceus TaxID=209559 RepID=A0A5N7CP59_PETAA|nr:hypothetical protein BDV23DRAFT_145610 [Aspergillus alliaceus]
MIGIGLLLSWNCFSYFILASSFVTDWFRQRTRKRQEKKKIFGSTLRIAESTSTA